jgi:hypothetical protein
VVVSTDRTTLPKEDKVCTSSAEAPMAQALVAGPGIKAPDDTLVDNDVDLRTFGTTESEIICQMSSWLQSYWPNSGNPDCLVWYFGWSSFYAP